MFYSRVLLVFILGLKLTCDSPKKKQPPYAHTPLARVHNHYLYKQDIENLVPPNTSPQDSLQIVERYIQNWLAKHLLASKAEASEEGQSADIDRKVAEFRSTLITHNYIQQLVNARLNKQITDEEIQAYYEANQEDFKLKHSIVRGKFMIIPKSAPNSHNLRRMIVSTQESDLTELQTYCAEFAKDYSLDDKAWLKWDDIVTKTPFRKVPDKTRLLKRTTFTEVQDQTYRYYLKIDAYRTANEIAPIEIVKNQIEDIILYKRKIELANQIKQEIVEQAKSANNYTIYMYEQTN